MSNALYLVITSVVACFMVSRVYLLIAKGQLNVKGVVYSRQRTPISYWITLIFAIVGTALTLVLAVAGIFWIIQGR